MLAGAILRQLVAYACMHHVSKAGAGERRMCGDASIHAARAGRNSAIFFALQLIFFLSFQSDTLVANAFGGDTTTREYATTLRFFVNIPGVVAVLSLPLWRSFAASVTQGDRRSAWQRFKHAENVVVGCSVALAASISIVLLLRPELFIGGPFPATTALVWVAWVGVLSWGQIMALPPGQPRAASLPADPLDQ
jgi:O-antigen/teichoic acid export membrane protein